MGRPISFTRNDIADSGAVVLSVSGEVDLLTADEFAKRLTDAAARPTRIVVVDLSGVQFLGSVALSALISTAETTRADGVELRIVARERIILRPLEITGINHDLHVFGTVEDALNAHQR